MSMLIEGVSAPDFTLLDQDNIERSLSDFNDTYVLIYFYPKDDTPGCTKEACMIRDAYNDFKTHGVTVLGISADSPESHKKFAEKYGLPFILLSDPKKEVITEYGAKGVLMTQRVSYLIDKNGVVIKTYPKVDPATHAAEILNDLKNHIQ